MTSVPDMMKQVMDRLEKLEARIDRPTSRALDHTRTPLTCWNCGKRGHIARSCRTSASGKRETLDELSRPVEGQDNPVLLVNDIVISTLPHETFFVYGHVPVSHTAEEIAAPVQELNWNQLSTRYMIQIMVQSLWLP